MLLYLLLSFSKSKDKHYYIYIQQIAVLDYNRQFVNHAGSAKSLAKSCLMKLLCVLIFLYITALLYFTNFLKLRP